MRKLFLGLILLTNCAHAQVGTSVIQMNWPGYSNWLGSSVVTQTVNWVGLPYTNVNTILITNVDIIGELTNVVVNGVTGSVNNAISSLTIPTVDPSAITNAAANGTLGVVSNGVSWLTISAGGGDVAAASNNVFTGTIPITFTTSNAAQQWISGSITNIHYMTATSDVTRINGTNYVFRP